MAPADMVDLTVHADGGRQASDVTGLVNTGQLGTMFADPERCGAVLESIERISGGNCQPGRHGRQARASER